MSGDLFNGPRIPCVFLTSAEDEMIQIHKLPKS